MSRRPATLPPCTRALTACALTAGVLALQACSPTSDPAPYEPMSLAERIPTVLEALEDGETELALAELARLAQAPDAPPGLEHFRGVALSDAGRYDEALQAFERELLVHPGNGKAHVLLAEALLELGRSEDAWIHAQQAQRLAPQLPFTAFITGRAALAREDDAAAAAAYEQYLRTDRISPQAAEAHHALAQISERGGDSERAGRHAATSQHLEQANQFLNSYLARLSDEQEGPEAWLGAGMVYLNLYRTVDPDPRLLARAEDAFRAALILDDTHIKALYNLGYILSVQGRTDEGQAVHDRALAVQPDHVGVLLNAGRLARRTGDVQRALRDLEQAAAVATQPDEQLTAHLELGDLLRELERLDEARLHYQAALDLDPDDQQDLRARLAPFLDEG